MQKPNSRTAPDLLDEMAGKYPDRPFVIDGEICLTYSEFRDSVRHHAKGFFALGLRRGSRVAILMGNRVEWLTSYFAAVTIGAEVVALNTLATARELAYQLIHAEVDVLVFEPKYRDRDFVVILADAAREHGLDPLPKYIPVDDVPPGAMSFTDLVEYGSRVDNNTLAAAQSAIEPTRVWATASCS